MKRIIIYILLTIFSISSFAQNNKNLSRLEQVPDIMQTDPENNFPDNGVYHCGAVAAANYLVWLSKNGYSVLTNEGKDDKDKVLKLANVLGGEKYMNVTSLGVTPKEFLDAVSTYISDCGYNIKKTEYWSWEHYNNDTIPDIHNLSQGFDEKGITFLLLGKYRYDSSRQQYIAVGLHYVSLIGYDFSKSTSDKDILIVNCSSPRSGIDYLNESLTINKISENIPFIINFGDIDINKSSNGYYEITDGLKWKRSGELIMINGFVYIEIE